MGDVGTSFPSAFDIVVVAQDLLCDILIYNPLLNAILDVSR